MQLDKRKQFLIVLASFLILGIPFKVMVLVEGLTEVRPVNAIPPVSGLLFGTTGAMACGIGNFIADLFGDFGYSSILGIPANFFAAFLPYRLWRLFSDEKPNLHSWKNIILYIGISFITAMTVAWMLSFGLHYFLGTWIEAIYTYIFFNNLGFSVGLGMPLLIILTSDSVRLRCADRPVRQFLLLHKKIKILACLLYAAAMAGILIGVVIFHQSPVDAHWMDALAAAGAVGLALQII